MHGDGGPVVVLGHQADQPAQWRLGFGDGQMPALGLQDVVAACREHGARFSIHVESGARCMRDGIVVPSGIAGARR
ncbi:hypothetical protein [Nonomuraea rosea]